VKCLILWSVPELTTGKSEEGRGKREEGRGDEKKGKQRSFMYYESSLLFLYLSLFFVKWHMGFACLRFLSTLTTPNLYRLAPG
jgi:hypothetical protein